MIWDSEEYEAVSGSVDKGQIEFTMNGKKLKGMFVLLKLKKGDKNWLLIKKKDGLAVDSFHIKKELTKQKMKSLKVKEPPCAARGGD